MTFSEMLNIQALNETKSLKYKNYFRAKQTIKNTSAVAPPEFRVAYFTSVPYARLGCQAINERIDLDSMLVPDSEKGQEFLNKTLKVNGGGALVASAHLSAMEYGRSYLVPTGSTNRDGLPILETISGRDMVHRIDAYTGELIEALQVFGENRDRYVYWTPGVQVTLIKQQRTLNETVILPDEGFEESTAYSGFWERRVSFSGDIPVFPLVCRGESDNTFGRPEAKDVFSTQDSACRYATDMAIASALLGTPRDILIGAEESDFGDHDADGVPVPGTAPNAEQLYMARMLTISDPAAKLVQTQAAQLQNFATALNSSDRRASAIMGVPTSTFGVTSDANPASGDAKVEDDKRLTRRAEILTRDFDPGWVNLGKYLLGQYGLGEHDVIIRWTDPSLPNLAGRADAVLKLSQLKDATGTPVYTWQELRRKLGDSEDEITEAESQRELVSIQKVLAEPNPPQPNPQTQGVPPNEQGTGTQSG